MKQGQELAESDVQPDQTIVIMAICSLVCAEQEAAYSAIPNVAAKGLKAMISCSTRRRPLRKVTVRGDADLPNALSSLQAQ